MHGRRHRHRGFRRHHGIGHGWYDRERVLERLEEYQRDLEQELADVTELIKRLRESETPQSQTEPQTI